MTFNPLDFRPALLDHFDPYFAFPGITRPTIQAKRLRKGTLSTTVFHIMGCDPHNFQPMQPIDMQPGQALARLLRIPQYNFVFKLNLF